MTGRFLYEVVNRKTGKVRSQRITSRKCEAATLDGDYYFGRLDLVGKSSHGRACRFYTDQGDAIPETLQVAVIQSTTDQENGQENSPEEVLDPNRPITLGSLAAKFAELAKERGEDTIVTFFAKDAYSVYGVEIGASWRIDDKFWEGTFTNAGHCSINFHIKDQVEDGETKNAKITFRKSKY